MSYLPAIAEMPATPPTETFALPHSAFLQAATYDLANYSLTLDFKSGHQIVHRYVFPMIWQQFKESPSHGSFYSRVIKGKYPAVSFRKPLLVSEFEKAVKKHRGHSLGSKHAAK